MDEDYPRNLLEFERRFSSEDACREYLRKLRWPEGFVCPRCGAQQAWLTKRNLLVCVSCQHQVSLTAGTIFQDTRKPLGVWFRAMVRSGRDRLKGTVEVDETYWGGEEEGVVGRLTHANALVLIAAQQDGKGIGRIRLARVSELTRKTTHGFIAQAVGPGSTVITDGLNVYEGLAGYDHRPIVLKRQTQDASTLLPCVHRVASLLKRWLMGTHQGAVRHEHLDYYLDEFTFRFNRRTSGSRGKLFYRLMQQAGVVEPVPYKDLIKHVSAGPHHKR